MTAIRHACRSFDARPRSPLPKTARHRPPMGEKTKRFFKNPFSIVRIRECPVVGWRDEKR